MSLNKITINNNKSEETPQIMRIDDVDFEKIRVRGVESSTKEVKDDKGNTNKLVSYKLKITYETEDGTDIDFEVELGKCNAPNGFAAKDYNGRKETSVGVKLTKSYQKIIDFLAKLEEKLWVLLEPHVTTCNIKKYKKDNNQMKELTWRKNASSNPFIFLKFGFWTKLRKLDGVPVDPKKLENVDLDLIPLVKFIQVSISPNGNISCNSELKSCIILPGLRKIDTINFQQKTADEINKENPDASRLLDDQLNNLGFNSVQPSIPHENDNLELKASPDSTSETHYVEEEKINNDPVSVKSSVRPPVKIGGKKITINNPNKNVDSILDNCGEEIK